MNCKCVRRTDVHSAIFSVYPTKQNVHTRYSHFFNSRRIGTVKSIQLEATFLSRKNYCNFEKLYRFRKSLINEIEFQRFLYMRT